ncbi:MAG: nuclear transport factor 2 family protein [Motilibacteraceae bacterium]
MNPSPDPIEAGLRAWGAGDLDALESLLAPKVSLRAVQPGPWNCVGREQVMALLRRRRTEGPAYPVHVRQVDEHTWTVTTDAPVVPDGPEPFPHGTRITVVDGLVTVMQQYRADAATV